MAESDFTELLHAAEQLSAEVEGSGDLPKVERTLRQVLEASTELWSRVTQTGAQDIQAHLLLGSKGVDLPQLSQKLEVLSARKTFEPLEPIPDTDIQSFLKNEKENAILSIIEETHRSCFDDTEKLQWEHIESEWKQEKQKALNALAGTSEEFLNLSLQPEPSIISDTPKSGLRSLLDNQEMAYAKQVIDYNKVVVQGIIRPSLVDKFSQVAESLNDKKVSELWEMVSYMSEVPPRATGDPLASRMQSQIRNVLIFQARKYLEDRYRTYMTSVVMGNLQQARRGGVPGTFPLVRSFVAVRIPPGMTGLEDGTVEDQPFWPLVYYCLRCGDIAAALYCARQAGSGMDEFCSVLEEVINSKDRKLSSRLETLIKFQYRRHIRNTTDPFKRAVYCVIGSCDVNDEHSEVAKAADDYLWLKLCQIREEESTESQVTDRMTYTHLQSLILEEYGESHYNAHEQPHVYFQVLILTGQFEAAIEFLARIEKLRVHAVHIAIALNEHHLLGIPANVQAPLLSVDPGDEPPARRLNLARLIMLYVRKFEATDPKEALQYYYFLRNMKGPEGGNLFMTCVSDLALESREFDLLLGILESTGLRLPGLIDTFQGVQADTKLIIGQVAMDSERKGMFEDAIKLYDLAGNHEKVLGLMTSMLSQVVHQVNRPGSLRSRLQELADNITSRYRGQQINSSPDIASTFFLLRDLLIFFDQYHAQEYHQALETISKMKLIPMTLMEVEERVNSFKRLGEEICRNIPDVLLATMNLLYIQYNKTRGGDANTSGTGRLEDKQLAYFREKARAITSFAGTVPYRMPGDTNSRLVQMEILMH
ncbi:nuclear pore complex protein Nup93-like [Zootermopsis nevadensis]|uniref:Nuclear pore protein n=1 Tax=Zootermopsis nevadensis TaxID=136037 RepID=A0A067QXW4_ZOONE|nr:nuclear pore complex protein Nup93-like [Zootermopsis nevadensis]XP_021935344.1 nuclear pore complex protein Nup93-like [Zootermopsis nevadensis]XP_021935345.1 nuclear pore complex protein Nup93-like [Zootermopsis nevadensis]XP_021935346.1 nuclear pore complex protein Nup93-like [Zootermopsis nevadensis]XP_021935347.1 nuclear pore complex protein Nup93-like [Zootermopsis nevadensis]XP_021935348.1 nuclear pore complex protein Nup93-like [Zootermopsis nevadensis]KDR10998.1 Nuclear pore compl